MSTIHGAIRDGGVHPDDPIPESWEGQRIEIRPVGPDGDVLYDEGAWAVFERLGPMEWALGEQAAIHEALGAMDHLSRDQVRTWSAGQTDDGNS